MLKAQKYFTFSYFNFDNYLIHKILENKERKKERKKEKGLFK